MQRVLPQLGHPVVPIGVAIATITALILDVGEDFQRDMEGSMSPRHGGPTKKRSLKPDNIAGDWLDQSTFAKARWYRAEVWISGWSMNHRPKRNHR
jgi:hypothetical protein